MADTDAAREPEVVDGIHPEDDGIDQGLRDAFDDVDPADPETRDAAPADDKPTGQPEKPAADAAGTADAEASEPPANWSAADQATFRELPEPARKMLLVRSKAMEAAHTQRSQEVAPLRQALQRWDPFLRQLGGDPLTTIDTAMGIVHTLRSGTPPQRAGLLNQLAHDFGVQVNGNGNGNGGQPRTPENDPLGVGQQIDAALTPIIQRLDGLQQAGQTAQQQQQQFQQQQQQQHRDQLRQTVDAFADAKDANGQPLHPHFDEVAATMAAQVQARLASGQPVDLAELYDAACWGTPSVREKLLSSRDAGNSQQRSQQEQAQNQQTARAAGSLTGRGRNSEVEEQPDDLDEALRQNMRLMG